MYVKGKRGRERLGNKWSNVMESNKKLANISGEVAGKSSRTKVENQSVWLRISGNEGER